MSLSIADEHLAASDPANALELAVQAHDAARTDGDRDQAASLAGRAHLALGHFSDAIAWLEMSEREESAQALAIARYHAGADGGVAPVETTVAPSGAAAELAAAMELGLDAREPLETLLAGEMLSPGERIDALRARCNVENLQKNWTAAIEWRRKVIAEAHEPYWLYELGQELFNAGLDDECEAVLRESIQLGSSRGRAQSTLGGLLLVTERFAEAEAVLREARELRPADAEVQFYLCRSIMKQARPDEARNELLRAAELGEPTAGRWCEQFQVPRPLLIFHEANNSLAAGDLDGAIAAYEQAAQLWRQQRTVHGDFFSRHLAMALSNCGFALFQKGAIRLAEESLRAALDERRGLRDAHNHLGNVLERGGQLEEALARFQRCAALDGRYAGAPYGEANILWQLGQRQEARAAIERALSIGYSDPAKQADLEARRADIVEQLEAS